MYKQNIVLQLRIVNCKLKLKTALFNQSLSVKPHLTDVNHSLGFLSCRSVYKREQKILLIYEFVSLNYKLHSLNVVNKLTCHIVRREYSFLITTRFDITTFFPKSIVI